MKITEGVTIDGEPVFWINGHINCPACGYCQKCNPHEVDGAQCRDFQIPGKW